MVEQRTYFLYIRPLFRINNEHTINKLHKILRITCTMPISTASDSHGDRLSINLKGGVTISNSVKSASQ